MAHSGARGGTEQIRQLAGMRGLMAKPNGTIIETPIKANFREGLSVLEYFSSTHGARKGLADTALKTADSGYLTRKLADVAQNVVITMHDCGSTQGISKKTMYKDQEVERPLAESIRGRVARTEIKDPRDDSMIVHENEMITRDTAKKIENLGIDKLLVRSPMTCQAPLGICRLCYGMDLATGTLVEEGMAVGIIAAQSIGEPGTQLTMRTFHIGGVVKREIVESDIKAKKAGTVRFERIQDVVNSEGKRVALTPHQGNGEIQIMGAKDKVLESYSVPHGAVLMVEPGQQITLAQIQQGLTLARWDPHITPIVAELDGKVRFDDVIEGHTLRTEKDSATGVPRMVIMEHKGDRHPQIQLEDDSGHIKTIYFMPDRAYLEVHEGAKVKAGDLLAKTPREEVGTQDITGGLPRVTEIFEARTPRDPARMAEISGIVELGEKKRGKRLDQDPAGRFGRQPGQQRRTGASRGPLGQAPAGPHRRPGQGGRSAGVRPPGAARHPQDFRSGGSATIPGPGSASRLSSPARRDRRQAHRDHRGPDAPQGEGRLPGRHGAAARLADRSVCLPGD